ncbi:MAG: diaminopimelate epimerase [Halobacteriovoraceae bacterium]|nr:diaminopimelate epimerase [Halobacteriovoraceae bacterium]
MKITFFKYSAQGNDFILIDNRKDLFDKTFPKEFWARLAKRKQGIGADGIILVEKSQKSDFKMRYFDADGGQSELCANGGRSILHFVDKILGINKKNYYFETKEGFYNGSVSESGVVELNMNPPKDENLYDLNIFDGYTQNFFINTGVPHAFFEVNNLKDFQVEEKGRAIRHHKNFAQGTNVNFFQFKSNNEVNMRTYERGVEGETLACGTGACGMAVYLYRQNPEIKNVKVHMPGGMLEVDLSQGINCMKILGPVAIVYQGVFEPEFFK